MVFYGFQGLSSDCTKGVLRSSRCPTGVDVLWTGSCPAKPDILRILVQIHEVNYRPKCVSATLLMIRGCWFPARLYFNF